MEEDVEEELEEEMFRAATEGDAGAVIRLLDADPWLLESDTRRGNRPLAGAARHGRLEMVRLLVQRGANMEATIEVIGRSGRTALHQAAFYGHEAVVAFLISNGARVDARDQGAPGWTPLMYACGNGHLSVVRMLLQHTGAQGLGERYDDDGRGETVLHWAAYCGRDHVVRCLLFAGADPPIRNKGGSTPRDIAEQPWTIERRDPRRRAECVAVFQWWEGELERRYVLSRATRLHKAYTTQRDLPTSQVPTYLEARVAAGHAVPSVEVVVAQSEEQKQEQEQEGGNVDASGKRKAADEGGDVQGAQAGHEERHAVLEYVMQGLNEELLTELLEGFHSAHTPESDQEEDDSDDEDKEEEKEEEGEEKKEEEV